VQREDRHYLVSGSPAMRGAAKEATCAGSAALAAISPQVTLFPFDLAAKRLGFLRELVQYKRPR